MNRQGPRDAPPLQLSLDFPQSVATLDALSVSPSNAGAIARLKQSPDWPLAAMALVGPAKSGLTTLSLAWAEEFGGRVVLPGDFEVMSPDDLEALASGFIAIDPGERLTDEARLLFLINQVGAKGGRLLLTSRRPPSQWTISQKDLRSRLRAMPVAEINSPDDAMVRARLTSAFARHFFRLPEDVANYLVLRLPRNYSGLEDYVTRLAGILIGSGRELTVPLARNVLRQELGNDDDDTLEEEGSSEDG